MNPTGREKPRAMDLAPDGKIVVSGYRVEPTLRYEPAVLRLTAGGTADSTFGPAAPVGFALFKVPGSEESRGPCGQGAGRWRRRSPGVSPRSGRGWPSSTTKANWSAVSATPASRSRTSGRKRTPPGRSTTSRSRRDGRIVVTGSSFPATDTKSQLIVARFTAGGDLDPSFGTGGVFTLNATAGYDEGDALSVLADGKVLVAGFRGHHQTPGSCG